MSKNAMAGAITLCGVGLCAIGGGLMMQSGSAAHAAGVMPAVAVAAATNAQAGPTIVWMGIAESHFSSFDRCTYHRLWSDGRLERRQTIWQHANYPYGPCEPMFECSTDWLEVPPPPGGNGFACRSDINGDRLVDGADLAFVLNSWGQNGSCEPTATYPCLNLGDLTMAAAMK